MKLVNSKLLTARVSWSKLGMRCHGMEWGNLHLERKSFHALPSYQCLVRCCVSQRTIHGMFCSVCQLQRDWLLLGRYTREHWKNKMSALANPATSFFIILPVLRKYSASFLVSFIFQLVCQRVRNVEMIRQFINWRIKHIKVQ